MSTRFGEIPVGGPLDADVAETLQRLETAVGPDVLTLICQAFLQDFPRDLGDLELALARADGPGGIRPAHTLKGSAASFGLETLSALAAGVEDACRAGTAPPASAMQQLHREFARVRAGIVISMQARAGAADPAQPGK